MMMRITRVVCLPRRLDLKPQLVSCFASSSPNCFCQFGTTFASDTGHTIAVSVVRLTEAEDTCACRRYNKQQNHIIIAQTT